MSDEFAFNRVKEFALPTSRAVRGARGNEFRRKQRTLRPVLSGFGVSIGLGEGSSIFFFERSHNSPPPPAESVSRNPQTPRVRGDVIVNTERPSVPFELATSPINDN